MDARRALAALSIAWAVRAGRAIPVRWSVRPHRPAHPDSALPLVRKSPHGGADRPPHLARHATISSLCYPPLYGSPAVDGGLGPQNAAYRCERLVVQLHRVPIHAMLDAHSFFAPFQIAHSLPHETTSALHRPAAPADPDSAARRCSPAWLSRSAPVAGTTAATLPPAETPHRWPTRSDRSSSNNSWESPQRSARALGSTHAPAAPAPSASSSAAVHPATFGPGPSLPPMESSYPAARTSSPLAPSAAPAIPARSYTPVSRTETMFVSAHLKIQTLDVSRSDTKTGTSVGAIPTPASAPPSPGCDRRRMSDKALHNSA